VRKYDCVELIESDGQCCVFARSFLTAAMENAAVQSNRPARHVEQVAGAGNLSRRADEGELHLDQVTLDCPGILSSAGRRYVRRRDHRAG